MKSLILITMIALSTTAFAEENSSEFEQQPLIPIRPVVGCTYYDPYYAATYQPYYVRGIRADSLAKK